MEEIEDIQEELSEAVVLLPSVQVDGDDGVLNPHWKDIFHSYQVLSQQELDRLGLSKGHQAYGHIFTTYALQPGNIISPIGDYNFELGRPI